MFLEKIVTSENVNFGENDPDTFLRFGCSYASFSHCTVSHYNSVFSNASQSYEFPGIFKKVWDL